MKNKRKYILILYIALTLPMFFSLKYLAYDNHIEVSRLIAIKGEYPEYDECFECHQPPVYYYITSFFLKFFHRALTNLP